MHVSALEAGDDAQQQEASRALRKLAATQIGANSDVAATLSYIAKEVMALVGCGSLQSRTAAELLHALGSGPMHGAARRAASLAVVSTWLPFLEEMETTELREKCGWLGGPTTGRRSTLISRLRDASEHQASAGIVRSTSLVAQLRGAPASPVRGGRSSSSLADTPRAADSEPGAEPLLPANAWEPVMAMRRRELEATGSRLGAGVRARGAAGDRYAKWT